jgi:hypothetical protein
MSRDVPARMGNRRRGGASTGRLIVDRLPARDCLRLTGAARFERKGGFEQAALDLDDRVTLCSVD